MVESSGAQSAHAATKVTTTYFTFKDFLSRDEVATFFQWPHAHQVTRVAEYLDFVGKQPEAAQFTSSPRASICYAERLSHRDPALLALDGESCAATAVTVSSELIDILVSGQARSGFGAFCTEPGFLPQKQLSLAVADSIEEIGHVYIEQRTKAGDVRVPVLNSRSFFMNWCHAEKQKLMDIRLKLDQQVGRAERHERRPYWERTVVVVDRNMCPDCIEYARSLASAEEAYIYVQDPETLRRFPPSKVDAVERIDIPTIRGSTLSNTEHSELID